MTGSLMGIQGAAEYLGLSAKTLYNWRALNAGPPAVKVGRLVKYRREDLEQWVADRVGVG